MTAQHRTSLFTILEDTETDREDVVAAANAEQWCPGCHERSGQYHLVCCAYGVSITLSASRASIAAYPVATSSSAMVRSNTRPGVISPLST